MIGHHPQKSRVIQFGQFCGVGITGVVLDLGVIQLTSGEIGYGAATVFAFLLATSWNYVWNYRVTWDEPAVQHDRAWARYIGSRLFPLAARFGILILTIELLGLPVLPASAIGIGVAGVVGFLTADRLVFDSKVAGSGARISRVLDWIRTTQGAVYSVTLVGCFVLFSVLLDVAIAPQLMGLDAAVYYTFGTRIVELGQVPYADYLNLKAPLAQYIPAVLVAVAGAKPPVVNLLGATVTGVAVLGVAVGTTLIADHLNCRPILAAAAGLWVFTFPKSLLFVSGYYPKLVAAGLAAVGFAAAIRDRPILGGVLIAASANVWQFAGVYLLAILAGGWLREDRREYLARFLAAAIGFTVLLWVPLVFAGAIEQAIIQTIIWPVGFMIAGPGQSGFPTGLLAAIGGLSVLIVYGIARLTERGFEFEAVAIATVLVFAGPIAIGANEVGGANTLPFIPVVFAVGAYGANGLWTLVSSVETPGLHGRPIALLLVVLVLSPLLTLPPIADAQGQGAYDVGSKYASGDSIANTDIGENCLIRDGWRKENWWRETRTQPICSGGILSALDSLISRG